MSKSLRVFLLSVLVVVLGVSSAFAALTEYTLKYDATAADGSALTDETDDNGNPYAEYDGSAATGTLLIRHNGIYSFSESYTNDNGGAGPVINIIQLDDDTDADGNTDGEVSEAVFVVPTPDDDTPSEGTTGTWAITWPTHVKDSKGQVLPLHDEDQDVRVKFTIRKRSTNSAIILTADPAWTPSVSTTPTVASKGGIDFIINAPIRVNANNAATDVTVTVRDGNTVTFDREAEIFWDQGIPNYPTGYNASSGNVATYTIDAGGELKIRNTWALRGSQLTVTAANGTGNVSGNKATLTFDLPAGSVHDLRGRIADATESTGMRLEKSTEVGHNALGGATLDMQGTSEINILTNMTLYGQIEPTVADGDGVFRVTKKGAGRLILADSSTFERPSIHNTVEVVTVQSGALEFASKQTWAPTTAANTPRIVIAKGATFQANSKSIENGLAAADVAFTVNGTAIFKDHAIVEKSGGVFNEIYPYEDFVTFNNGLRINATDIVLSIPEGGKVIIDNGSFAAGTIAGKGDIEIRNTVSPDVEDRAVLILTNPEGTDSTTGNPYALGNNMFARNYIDFEGTISGAHANVGLYAINSTRQPYSRRIFRSADVDIDNLIVYGPAQLNVAETTDLDGVKNIWLRGHRPGANNSTAATAYSKLTVGKLNFIPGDTNTEIRIDSLKVDGSSSEKDMGSVNVLNYDNDAQDPDTATYPKTYDTVNDRDAGTLGPRINAYIDSLMLYANRGVSKDFKSDYVLQNSDEVGVYALKLNGAEQPSRIIIDGTKVTGDGRADDVTAKVYQVQIESDSDVKFTGKGDWRDYQDYYPLAHNNSLLVKSDAKLEIRRGGIIDGNLTFEPSTLEAFNALAAGEWPAYDSHVNGSDYPADDDFESDEGWYDGDANGYLNRYTTFTTQVGKRNRRTNEGGEYAVKVTGDLTLSQDNTEGYAGDGKVVVRVKPDLSAFDAYEFTTIGQRFKALGLEGNGTYSRSFATSYNDMFQFRIPSTNADTTGVTVENRTELAIVTLDDWSFLAGGSEFGMGDGHNFSIKVPFSVTIRGQKATIKRELDHNNDVRYSLGIGNDKYYFTIAAGFLDYADGANVEVENVSDIGNNILATLVRDDITLRAEPDITDDEQYIRLIGTSYTGEAPANVELVIFITQDPDPVVGIEAGGGGYQTTMTWLDGAIPGYRTYSFIREGAVLPDSGPQWSTATAEAVGKTDFIVGDTGNAVFTVTGLRKATYNTGAAAVFNGTTYVWQNGADTDTYYMLDNSGKETKVGKPSVRLYNGDYLARTTTSADVTSFDIVFNGNVATVTVPVSALGTTNGALDAIKMLSVKARKDGGNNDIMSEPVGYTLHASVAETDTTPLGTQTATTTSPAEFHYDVDPSVLSGDLHFILYDKGNNSWLGFYEYEDGFGYNTKDLTGVAPGIYNFQVLAYSGANSTDSKHVLYTFSVNVGGVTPTPGPDDSGDQPAPVGPAIRADKTTVTVALPDGTDTVTFTLVGGAADLALADNTNPAGLVTLSGTTATVVAAGTAPGTYTYTFTATAASGDVAPVTLTVTVRPEPVVEFGIEEIYNGFTDYSPVADHTYYAIFAAVGVSGDVVWAVTDRNADGDTFTYSGEKHTAKSGDMFMVEGTVAAGAEQGFVVTATAGSSTVEYEVTFDVDADEITGYQTLNTAAGAHTAVTTGYRVNFPAGVVADVDSVFLPIWLQPVFNTDDEVIGVEFAGTVGDLANGTTGKVVVEATDADGEDVYYKWDVTYNAEPAALEVTATPATLSFVADSNMAQNVTLTANIDGVTYTSDKTWAVVNGNIVTVTTPEASDTITITATDTLGRTKTVTIAVTVTSRPQPSESGDHPVPGSEFMYSVVGNTTVSVALAARDTSITITPRNASGDVTYTSSASWVTVDSSTGVVAITPTDSSLVRSTPHTVTITLTDNGRTTDNTQTVTLTITVTGGGIIPVDEFTLTASPSAIRVSEDETVTVTLTPRNATGTVTYSANQSWVTFSGNTATIETPEVDQTTIYTITITARDSDGDTAVATVTVTVEAVPVARVGSSGGGCDAGFGALALALAAPLFLRRRRS